MIDTKLTNITSRNVIKLADDLYPVEDLSWSPVVSNTYYSLNGSMFVFQGVRKAGRPFTMQSPDDLGWLSRDTVNRLHLECAKVNTKFWLEYLADGGVKQVKVMFDHGKTPIEATPVKKFNSPRLDDQFLVTLRFIEVT